MLTPKRIRKVISRVICVFLPGITLKRLLANTVHAVWMIAFSLLWLSHVNMYDGFDFMNEVMDYKELLSKHILNKKPELLPTEKYLLLNTSKNNEILPADNDNTLNTVITDREALLKSLQLLDSNSDKISLVICDVFFESPSSNRLADSLLGAVVQHLDAKNKLILPALYYDDDASLQLPLFSCRTGVSQYRSSFLNEQFLKYSFMLDDTLKQLPLIAYENITGHRMEKKRRLCFPYYTMNGKWCLNTIIPEIRYAADALEEDVSYHHIGTFSREMLKDNQIVVIGDFEGKYDVHSTIADNISGALILINALEALMNGDNIIGPRYLLMLFVFFFFVGYYTFFNKDLEHQNQKFINKSPFFRFLVVQSNYLLLLLLVLISMLYFHHYIHFLILMSYFMVIDIVLYLINQCRSKKQKVKKSC
ncbi:MAG TPA: CHASE2 domain-containing protein [Bacteroidales bacterium]|nr:CHASE2 domain-containing protein [Bacteroidales bacterium]HPB25919.1 CHASE2 domain-containing protein [Bacteroidales bacterium]HPI31127.1 CHASE2 domain-containing protein [Bacteroidales bacterium]HQN15129.1 CHASE2 domain-containing protein [Bacteroidales bacterium]HQP14863.1 CHASE2 domain-containing protein [Bacteroidales bacterium]